MNITYNEIQNLLSEDYEHISQCHSYTDTTELEIFKLEKFCKVNYSQQQVGMQHCLNTHERKMKVHSCNGEPQIL